MAQLCSASLQVLWARELHGTAAQCLYKSCARELHGTAAQCLYKCRGQRGSWHCWRSGSTSLVWERGEPYHSSCQAGGGMLCSMARTAVCVKLMHGKEGPEGGGRAGARLRLEGVAAARLELHDLVVDGALRRALLELHVVVAHVGLRSAQRSVWESEACTLAAKHAQAAALPGTAVPLQRAVQRHSEMPGVGAGQRSCLQRISRPDQGKRRFGQSGQASSPCACIPCCAASARRAADMHRKEFSMRSLCLPDVIAAQPK